MPFAGYLVFTGEFVLISGGDRWRLGCNLGSTIAYFVGYRGGRPLIERWGRYILMSHEDLERAERFFARFGSLAVFIARLLPVVRTFIALPAGIARMPQLKFQHLYVPRLLALVSRAGLDRLSPRPSLGKRSPAAQDHAPVGPGHGPGHSPRRSLVPAPPLAAAGRPSRCHARSDRLAFGRAQTEIAI